MPDEPPAILQTLWATLYRCEICGEETDDPFWYGDLCVCGKCTDRVDQLFAFICLGGNMTPPWRRREALNAMPNI